MKDNSPRKAGRPPLILPHNDLIAIYNLRRAGHGKQSVADAMGYDKYTIRKHADSPENVSKYSATGEYHPPFHDSGAKVIQTRAAQSPFNDTHLPRIYSLRKLGMSDGDIVRRLGHNNNWRNINRLRDFADTSERINRPDYAKPYLKKASPPHKKGQRDQTMSEEYLYEKELWRKIRASLSLSKRQRAEPESTPSSETQSVTKSEPRPKPSRTFTDVRHTAQTLAASTGDNEVGDYDNEYSRRLQHRIADHSHNHALKHTEALQDTFSDVGSKLLQHVQDNPDMPEKHAAMIQAVGRILDRHSRSLGKMAKEARRGTAASRTNDIGFLSKGVKTKRLSPPTAIPKGKPVVATKKVDRSEVRRGSGQRDDSGNKI
jgi:hypothetical protein